MGPELCGQINATARRRPHLDLPLRDVPTKLRHLLNGAHRIDLAAKEQIEHPDMEFDVFEIPTISFRGETGQVDDPSFEYPERMESIELFPSSPNIQSVCVPDYILQKAKDFCMQISGRKGNVVVTGTLPLALVATVNPMAGAAVAGLFCLVIFGLIVLVVVKACSGNTPKAPRPKQTPAQRAASQQTRSQQRRTKRQAKKEERRTKKQTKSKEANDEAAAKARRLLGG